MATIDLAIREAYQKQRPGDRQALRAVGRKVGCSRNAVSKRGAELGVTRAKELPWSADKEELLERFGHLAPSGIQRHLSAAGCSRSIAAIQIKLNRTRIKQNLDGYSANSLAGALGINVHKDSDLDAARSSDRRARDRPNTNARRRYGGGFQIEL